MASDHPDALIDAITLIQAVKERPCLYEREQSYGDVNYKRVAWEDVTKTVFSKLWPKYNDEEKAEKVDQVIKRWRNIQNCFAREVKRQKEPKWVFGISYKRRPYIYYNDLLFLKSELDNAEEDAMATNEIDLPENNEAHNITVTVDTNFEEITIPEPLHKIRSPSVPDKAKTPNTDNIKTSLNCDKTGSSSKPDATTNADPDSTHFALSLVPMLNMIPVTERVEAEINILSVLQPFLKRSRGEEGNERTVRSVRKRRLLLPADTTQMHVIKSEASSDDEEDFYE